MKSSALLDKPETDTREGTRVRLCDAAINRIIKARAGLSDVKVRNLAQSRLNGQIGRLRAALDTTWQACRQGQAQDQDFELTLEAWEDENLKAIRGVQ